MAPSRSSSLALWVGLLSGLVVVLLCVHEIRSDPGEGAFLAAAAAGAALGAALSAAGLWRRMRAARPRSGHRISVGAVLPGMELETVTGRRLTVPDPDGRFTHLQFRRFAGCPLCNTHLRTFQSRRAEIDREGICEVVFFHSSAALIVEHEEGFDLNLVADPTLEHYRRFGVEVSSGALLHPKVFGALLRSVTREKFRFPRVENGRLGLPADILLDGSGRVIACHYGSHAYDQWTVDELLALAEEGRRGIPS